MSPLKQVIYMCTLLSLFIFLEHFKIMNMVVFLHMCACRVLYSMIKIYRHEKYCYIRVCVIPIWLLTRYNIIWTVGTTVQHIFTVSQRILVWFKKTHCFHDNVCWCFLYITSIRHHIIFISFENTTFHFKISSVLGINYVVF